MGLLEDIKQTAIEMKKANKRDLLLTVREEIELMIKEKIPLTKQIELLIKNEIIDSIDLKYYRNILKTDFEYGIVKKEDKKTIQQKQKREEKIKREKTISKKPVSTPKKTATEMLSQSIELAY